MKTSNIILLALFLFVLLSLFSFNWILVHQFKLDDNLSNDFDPPTSDLNYNLPAFRHIVMDAALKAKDGATIPMPFSWYIRANGTEETASITFPRLWQDILITQVANDTLYITFEKEKVNKSMNMQLLQKSMPDKLEIVAPCHSVFYAAKWQL